MLKQRVLTAIVLLVILAATVSVASNWPFFIFLSVACSLAGWEWCRLTSPSRPWVSLVTGAVLAFVTLYQAYLWQISTAPDLRLLTVSVMVSAAVWIFAVLPAVYRGRADAAASSLVWTLFAPVSLFSTWAALAHLYSNRSASYVLSLLILIWVADIAAYFAGKAFGKNKLAPRISPGKTLEGAAAGVVGVFIWVLGCALFWPNSFGSALVSQWSWLGAGLLAILLAVVSIAGDLFESLLKRRAGVKDSSQLLPGHGGVYDRIDAVVAVVPLAYLLTEGLSW
jgi:phosphatidate cytidylyltransferase